MKQLEYALANETEVLTFLKSKYPLYHLSNVFFRDIQYGLQTFFFRKKMSIGYTDAEKIARAFVTQLEKKKVLNSIDQQSWVLHYPEFKKPSVAPAAPSKPAAKQTGTAPAIQSPAAATPAAAKPSLPPINRPATALPKTGGLPPLASASAPKTETQSAVVNETPKLMPAGENQVLGTSLAPDAPKAEGPIPTQAATTVPSGEKKPLPPLRSSTPAEPTKE